LALIQAKPGAVHGRARSICSDKLYYVLEGLVEFQVGEIIYWLTQGDLLVIPKGGWFNYRNGGPGAATLLLVHTPPRDRAAEEFVREA